MLWVSTRTDTRGGVATYVRTLQGTPLWERWRIRHVATHRNGSRTARVGTFAMGVGGVVRELAVRRPGLVHLHTSCYGSFARKSALAWMFRAAGIPVVMHVHGGAFGDFYARSPRLLQRYIRRTLSSAERVIGLGDRWAAALQRIAPDARVIVVPNAVSPRTLVDQPGPGEPVHVLFVGEMTEDKGAFALLEAWRQLREEPHLPCADLVMVGPGDLERAWRETEELGPAGQVRVLGWVESAEVERLLSHSHVLVLPSRFEGQPMAVLEAMAHGLCVVATEVGGIPDLVDDECAVLVPVDDGNALVAALRTVISDPGKRSELGALALARVRARFDVALAWRTLDALYEELVR
ncbi:Glycosyltransferase involved in cell wall bisynthesis [Geodermatophilus pulveris]|uniref:Glycosyltransferase involved in cell wall bisynthesis n=1 Tax=Geodermatophilus pulveris TaxID=1564159 RepID=A0A239JA18_9ACTN|nr:Glycosyltransferase involved in cell wall bisynthesis [Geodermatophilus pulveris]